MILFVDSKGKYIYIYIQTKFWATDVPEKHCANTLIRYVRLSRNIRSHVRVFFFLPNFSTKLSL